MPALAGWAAWKSWSARPPTGRSPIRSSSQGPNAGPGNASISAREAAMSAIDRLLEGAVDLHFHSHPSPFPRAMDAAAAAEKYDAAGFRAVVMKSHHHSTVMEILALERLALKGLRLQVFGGIALNGAVGGLNPRAVDLAIQMGGKVVWFPTIASANH